MTHPRHRSLLLATFAVLLIAASCGGGAEVPTTRLTTAATLSADAIGAIDIGQPPAAVIDEMTAMFGAPDEDSFWVDADSPLYGECPGAALRAVGWGSLYLFFTADEPITADNENVASRLFTYSYGYDFSRNEGATDPRGLDLVTETGIGLGSSRAELRSAHGPDLSEVYDETTDTWTWSIDESGQAYLAGLLSGPEDEATVVLIERKPGCGGV